jgi:hypothetical protein
MFCLLPNFGIIGGRFLHGGSKRLAMTLPQDKKMLWNEDLDEIFLYL